MEEICIRFIGGFSLIRKIIEILFFINIDENESKLWINGCQLH